MFLESMNVLLDATVRVFTNNQRTVTGTMVYKKPPPPNCRVAEARYKGRLFGRAV